jgi:hypothetical protein
VPSGNCYLTQYWFSVQTHNYCSRLYDSLGRPLKTIKLFYHAMSLIHQIRSFSEARWIWMSLKHSTIEWNIAHGYWDSRTSQIYQFLVRYYQSYLGCLLSSLEWSQRYEWYRDYNDPTQYPIQSSNQCTLEVIWDISCIYWYLQNCLKLGAI